MTMKTLNEMWETKTQEQYDVTMDDMEVKIANESTNHNARNTEKDNQPANDDNKHENPTADGVTHYEFAVRIKIKANNNEDAHQKHKQLLGTIQKEHKHFRLYSKKNEIVTTTDLTSNHFEYNEVGKNTKYYIVVHGIELDNPYYKIKHNENVFQSLKQTNCYIQQHVWPESEWNIASIGFLSGISPKHQSKEMTKRNLHNPHKNPPRYELAATTIKTTIDGVAFSTFAYEVKCIEKDKEAVCNYLTKVGKSNNVTLLKHKWKYTNSDVYTNGIRKQNELIQNIRTIPIYGIDDATMESLYDTLVLKEEIINVTATNKTGEYGRWNVYTLLKDFGSTTEWLQHNLKQMYNECRKDCMITSEVPHHFVQEVKFNTTINFSSKINDPHLESATSSVSKYSSSPALSWASVVSGYPKYRGHSTKSNSPTTSTISSPSDFATTLQHITNSMEKICERLDKIEARLDKHDKASQQTQKFQEDPQERTTHKIQQFETSSDSNTNQDNWNRLGEVISRLEERMNSNNCRKLRITEEQTRPNKWQDLKQTPTKHTNQT